MRLFFTDCRLSVSCMQDVCLCKDNASESNESLFLNCRAQLILCKDIRKSHFLYAFVNIIMQNVIFSCLRKVTFGRVKGNLLQRKRPQITTRFAAFRNITVNPLCLRVLRLGQFFRARPSSGLPPAVIVRLAFRWTDAYVSVFYRRSKRPV